MRLGKFGELHSVGVFCDTLHNPLVGIFFSELIQPLRAFPALTDDRPIFAVWVKAHTVSHFSHNAVKIFQRERFADSFVHRLPCDIIPCGHTVFLRLIQSVWLFSSAWVFNDGQSILTAKLIGTLAQKPQVCFVVVVMPAVRERYGVYDKVVMQAVGIQVCGNDYLKSVAPHLLSKFYADLVRLLWRDLAVLKALEAVIADNLAFIVPLRFCNHHFISGGGRVAVYARDKITLLGLILVGGVFHYIDHSLQIRFGVFGVSCLFGIFRIIYGVVEPATHIPYFTDCHYGAFLGSRYFFRTAI